MAMEMRYDIHDRNVAPNTQKKKGKDYYIYMQRKWKKVLSSGKKNYRKG